MLSILCPFFLYHKNGYGVNHGVVMLQNPRQKQLICATIRWQKSPNFRWIFSVWNFSCSWKLASYKCWCFCSPTYFLRWLTYLLFGLQGARRIVAEWPDLDLEARKFTARILGDDLEPIQSPDQSKDSTNEDSLKEDLESKAELWFVDTIETRVLFKSKFLKKIRYSMQLPQYSITVS